MTVGRGRIVHLTSLHPAGDLRILHKECGTLVRAGYDVVLIAPGEGRRRELGVEIVGLATAKGRLRRMTVTLLEVFRAALRERGDVYHFHDPELIPVGILLRLSGKRVVYDVHEDVPKQVLSKHWIPAWLRPGIAVGVRVVESVGTLFFDRVVAATPWIAERFPAGKTVTVRNYPMETELLASAGQTYATRPRRIACIGAIAEVRGIREIVRSMELVADPEARLVLAGAFSPPGLRAEIEAMPGWGRVDFRGYLDRPGVARALGEARAGLVILRPAPNYLESLPVKLFEYLAAGVPVIASDFPLWREIVDEAHAGILVDPMDPAAVAAAIDWMLANPGEAEAMGRRGQLLVRERLNWKREGEALVAAYEHLAGPGRRG